MAGMGTTNLALKLSSSEHVKKASGVFGDPARLSTYVYSVLCMLHFPSSRLADPILRGLR